MIFRKNKLKNKELIILRKIFEKYEDIDIAYQDINNSEEKVILINHSDNYNEIFEDIRYNISDKINLKNTSSDIMKTKNLKIIYKKKEPEFTNYCACTVKMTPKDYS